jgi:hypothetical protein
MWLRLYRKWIKAVVPPVSSENDALWTYTWLHLVERTRLMLPASTFGLCDEHLRQH